MLNKSTIALLAVVFLFLAASSNVSVAQQSDEQALRHLKEVEWPRAYRDQDTKLLDRLLADEFQMIHADGLWTTKKDELEYVSKNKPSYESFRFEIKRLEIFPNGTAIVSGTGHVLGKDKDGPYKVVYQSSNVLIKRSEGWKAVASHVSGVKRSVN